MMKYRTVKLIYPIKKKSSQISMFTSRVPFSKGMTIYQTVDVFKETIFSITSKIKLSSEQIKNRALLMDIINLHNTNGIRDPFQIKSMVQQIKSGKGIFAQGGLPNVKLVKTKDQEWVLFDGHHSLLAYMISGKKYLDEVPHLTVENREDEGITDKEIIVFFGEHLTSLRDDRWRKYVINWQAPRKEQLQSRLQKNMGELLDALIVKIAQ